MSLTLILALVGGYLVLLVAVVVVFGAIGRAGTLYDEAQQRHRDASRAESEMPASEYQHRPASHGAPPQTSPARRRRHFAHRQARHA